MSEARVVDLSSIPEGYEVVDGVLTKKKKAKGKSREVDLSSIPEGYEVVDGVLTKKSEEDKASLTDPLFLLDAIDAPIREGIYKAQEGEGTGLANIGEFAEGVGEHFSRYKEGPIDAIKGTPSKGFIKDIAFSPTTYTGLGGLLRTLGKATAKAGAKKAGGSLVKAGDTTIDAGKSIGKKVLPDPVKAGETATELRLRQLTPQTSPNARHVKALAKQLYGDEEILKHINDPTAMERFLSGTSQVDEIVDQTTGKIAYKRGGLTEGYIGKKSGELADFLQDNRTHFTHYSINRKTLSKQMVDDVMDEFIDPITGSHAGEVTREQAVKFVENVLGDIELTGKRLGPDTLLKIKRTIGDRLNPKNFAHDTEHAVRTRMLRRASGSLDEQIEGIAYQAAEEAAGPGAGDILADTWRAKNREISNLIKLRDVVFAPAYKNLTPPTKADIVLGAAAPVAKYGATGYAAGKLAGIPGIGAAIGASGALHDAARKSFRDSVATIPGWRAKQWKKVENLQDTNVMDRMIPMIPKALPRDQEGPMRQPQSMLGAPMRGQQPMNLPDLLVNTPLPRDSEKILKNPDFFLMKLAQQAPEAYDMMKNTIANDPEGMAELLPSLVQMAPNLFERDEFNRVDGMIMGEEYKIKARRRVMTDQQMRAADKIQHIDRLNRTGEFDL